MQNDLIVNSNNRFYQTFIENDGESKYILCQLDIKFNEQCNDLISGRTTDDTAYNQFIKNEKNERSSPRFIVIALDLPYHIEIYEEFKERLKLQQRHFNQISTNQSLNLKYKLSCLGGGILSIDYDKKVIKTFGKSYHFGPPDIKMVEKVIQNTNVLNYDLDIKITNEVRG